MGAADIRSEEWPVSGVSTGALWWGGSSSHSDSLVAEEVPKRANFGPSLWLP